MGLGHKGADPEGQPQAWGGFFELEQEVGGGLDVVFVFRGQASHAVELQAAEATLFGVAGGGIDLLGGQLFVDHLAHALAAAFDGDRQGLAAAFGEDPPQLGGDGGGPHGADADAGVIKAVLIEPLQQVAELGVLGHRGPQQAQALGGA